MNFEIQVAHSVAEIGQSEWDRLSAGRPFASHRWYSFGEAVLSDCLPIYIVLSDHGEALARATFWLKKREPLPISSRPMRLLMEAILRRWPLMMCQVPLTSLSGLTLPDSPLRTPALKRIVQVAQEEARKHQASFLIFSYLEQVETGWEGWPQNYAAVTTGGDPGTSMTIAWPDFESYLKHLSRKTQKNYRRNCRSAEGLGLEVKNYSTVPAIEESLRLIRNVEQRHSGPPNPWMRGMLEHAHRVNAVWVTAEIKDRVAGCELVLGDGDTFFVTALGLDYQVPYTYFMLGYADIRWAIEAGAKCLRWGSGAYEAKQRLGFQLESNNAMLYLSQNPWLQRLGAWATHLERAGKKEKPVQ